MYLLSSGNQAGTDRSYRADGSLGNTSPKLILPQAQSRAMLSIQNIGSNQIYLEHGCARATTTLTSGAVTAITILNPGFGFVKPPIVTFKGGGQVNAPLAASNWDGRGQIDAWAVPNGYNSTTAVFSRPARAIAVLTSGVVTSFVIEDGGAGYITPPEILLTNDPNDPYGCADPSYNSGSGVVLNSLGTYFLNGTFCHTDAIALYAASGAATYYCEYAP